MVIKFIGWDNYQIKVNLWSADRMVVASASGSPSPLQSSPRLASSSSSFRAGCSKPDGAFFANSVSRSLWMDG